MECLHRHTVDGGLPLQIVGVVIALKDGFVLVLPINEVEVVFAFWINFDWSIHKLFM